MNFGDGYIEVNPYKYDAEMPKEPPKYRLIDILNKIANGELKEGTKVKYLGDTYLYYRDTLVRGEDHHLLEDIYLNEIREECELIEPQEPTDNTKIEELKTYENSVMDIFYKLNEVIRKINKEG